MSTGLEPTALGLGQSSDGGAIPLALDHKLRYRARILTTLGGVAVREGLRRNQRGREGDRGEELGKHCVFCPFA